MPRQHGESAAPRVLIVGCGALANELVALTRAPAQRRHHLPAGARSTTGPAASPARCAIASAGAAAGYDRVFVAYADCGTGGLLDPVIAEEGVERLAGAHCYEFYAGREAFEQLSAEELGTFYLTDFLARNFDRLVIGAPRPGSPPRAARHVLRQLPPARLPRPDRGPGRSSRRRAGRRGGSAWPSSTARPATASWPPRSRPSPRASRPRRSSHCCPEGAEPCR